MAKDVEKKSKKEKKHFFKDFKAELKKVIWPTPKQVVNNTVAVITIVLITAVIVFILDLIFGAINTHGIDNIRNLVRNENTVNTTVDDHEGHDHEHDHENEVTEESNEVQDNGEAVVDQNNVQE